MTKWKKLSLFIGVPILLVVSSILGTMWLTHDEGPVSTSEMSIDQFEALVVERDRLNKKIEYFMTSWDRRRKKYETLMDNQPDSLQTRVQ